MTVLPILDVAKSDLAVMADFGLTCSGDLKRALLLVEVAAELGVNAVKFQALDPLELLGDKSVEYTYPTYSGSKITENMCNMFSKLTFTYEEWHKIKDHCCHHGIDLVVTCHVESLVPLVNSLELSCNKICTWSLNHYRMIQELARNKKPLILDSGTINISELNDLRDFYISSGGSEIFVLFDLHTQQVEQMNMRAMHELHDHGYRFGYTPQGRDNFYDYMAIGLGASMLEKRLTLSRTTNQNGHWKSLEPSEFYDWMQEVKKCHRSLGNPVLTASDADISDSLKYYKSAYLTQSVKQGQIIESNHFRFLRPGTGISSKDIISNFLGKPYSKDYIQDEMFIDAL